MPADRNIGYEHIVEPIVKSSADLDRLRFIMPGPETADVGDIVAVRELIGELGIVACRPTGVPTRCWPTPN